MSSNRVSFALDVDEDSVDGEEKRGRRTCSPRNSGTRSNGRLRNPVSSACRKPPEGRAELASGGLRPGKYLLSSNV